LCQTGETIGKEEAGPIVEHSGAVVPEQHGRHDCADDSAPESSWKLL
jgi:hypothetical protein